jgi:hypothetical protein
VDPKSVKPKKKLSLSELKSSGPCYVGKPVPVNVEWSVGDDDYEIDVFVRPFSYSTAVSDLESLRDPDAQSNTAKRIATSVVDESGNPVFSVGDITGDADPERGPMSSAMVMALLGAMGKANGMGKPSVPPTSTPEPKSGASLSSTVSADTASSKRKKT